MTELSKGIIETYEDTQKDIYLIFVIENEQYGIEIKYVTEIVGIQKITKIPNMPTYIKGIMNLRGTITPLVDLRVRLQKDSIEHNDRTCVIIVNIYDVSVGLIVDYVESVLEILEIVIVPFPKLNSGFRNKYITGIGKIQDIAYLLVDCKKILYDEDI